MHSQITKEVSLILKNVVFNLIMPLQLLVMVQKVRNNTILSEIHGVQAGETKVILKSLLIPLEMAKVFAEF